VAVSTVPPDALLTALRAAGYLPAEEESDGALVIVSPAQHRHPRTSGHLLGGPTWTPPEKAAGRSNPAPVGEASADRPQVQALVAALREAATGRPGRSPAVGRTLSLWPQGNAGSFQAPTLAEFADELANSGGRNHDWFPIGAVHDGSGERVVLNPYDRTLPSMGMFDEKFSDNHGIVATSPVQFAAVLLLAQREARTVIIIVAEALDEPDVTVVGFPVEVTETSVLMHCTDCNLLHDISLFEISHMRMCSRWADEHGNEP
jgi:hypothetical protein